MQQKQRRLHRLLQMRRAARGFGAARKRAQTASNFPHPIDQVINRAQIRARSIECAAFEKPNRITGQGAQGG